MNRTDSFFRRHANPGSLRKFSFRRKLTRESITVPTSIWSFSDQNHEWHLLRGNTYRTINTFLSIVSLQRMERKFNLSTINRKWVVWLIITLLLIVDCSAYSLERFCCWNSRRQRYKRIYSQRVGSARCPRFINRRSSRNYCSSN